MGYIKNEAPVSIAKIFKLLETSILNKDHLRQYLPYQDKILFKHLNTVEGKNQDSVCFYKGISKEYIYKLISEYNDTLILVTENIFNSLASDADKHADLLNRNIYLLACKNPFESFISLIDLFYTKETVSPNISLKASIDPTAKIDPSVTIMDFVTIAENVVIEQGSVIYPNVVIYKNVHIGKNTIIHGNVTIRESVILKGDSVIQPGAVIGSDGFGYIPTSLGLKHVPQLGTVILERAVDIGANSCIDRGALGDTSIGESSKLDNLVQVGHNVKLGKHCILCGQSGIAGSTTLGDQVVISGQSGVVDHVQIASGIRIGAKSAVLTSLEEKGDYSGTPAQKHKSWLRERAGIRKILKNSV